MKKQASLRGTVSVPGDKSISHRAVMFGSISKGSTKIENILRGEDVLSSISCFKAMGVEIEDRKTSVIVNGKGLRSLKEPDSVLYTGNSGTTTRLISGILSAQDFPSYVTGDASIRKRPMKRIMDPLRKMGAEIESENGDNCPPLIIKGHPLKGIEYNTPVASAQVKSAIMLAALYADSPTTITEPYVSRNHSEIMLKAFGADITSFGTSVFVDPATELYGGDVLVPGDISSAAFFIAAALITEDSDILIKDVGINPTRDGILKAAAEMGGRIEILNKRTIAGEDIADIHVMSSDLKGIKIGGEIIPSLIDEIPIIAVMASRAKGTTVIKDASELKVKESNRISAVCNALSSMGCDIQETDDGMIIKGGKTIYGTKIDTRSDHRIAMSFAVSSLVSEGPVIINDSDCVNISYPNFYEDLCSLSDRIKDCFVRN